MEPTVLSGPLGHKQWEPDQPFPVGFHTLDTDNGVLGQNKSGQTGLDFRNGDQDTLVGFMNISNLSCGDLNFDGGHSSISQASLHGVHIEGLSYAENTEGPEDSGDCTLSWLFSSSLTDVVGTNSAYEELSVSQEAPLVSETAEAELISLVAVSPSNISEWSPEINTDDPFSIVDLLSNEPCFLPLESPGDFDPQGVSEELVDVSQVEQAGLPPSQSRDTLLLETGDKGLFPDQVTDLLVTIHGLPENGPSQNHVSTPLECCEGSVPLLDLEVPDCDGSLSLCPASPAAFICTDTLNSSTEEPQVEHGGTGVIGNQTSEQQGENGSLFLGSSAETSPLTVPLAEDAVIQGDFTIDSYALEKVPKDLMEDQLCSDAKSHRNEAMALGLCLTANEVHGEEPWDLKPQEDVQNVQVSNLTTLRREEDGLADGNQLEASDYREVASFDFSLQDLNTSPEAGWTTEQSVETVSPSKMVVDDSLPLVSAADTREQDVSPLKAVFDALDQDGDGFVRIEEFMEFAAAYGADQVRCFFFFYY